MTISELTHIIRSGGVIWINSDAPLIKERTKCKFFKIGFTKRRIIKKTVLRIYPLNNADADIFITADFLRQIIYTYYIDQRFLEAWPKTFNKEKNNE